MSTKQVYTFRSYPIWPWHRLAPTNAFGRGICPPGSLAPFCLRVAKLHCAPQSTYLEFLILSTVLDNKCEMQSDSWGHSIVDNLCMTHNPHSTAACFTFTFFGKRLNKRVKMLLRPTWWVTLYLNCKKNAPYEAWKVEDFSAAWTMNAY